MRIGKVLDLDQKAAFRTKTSIDIANRMINNRTKVSEFVKYTKNSPVLHLYRAKATLSIKEQADAQYKKDLKKISKEISNDLTEYFTPMSNYFNRRQHERNHRHANNLSKLPISIKNKAATDTEEHVNASSIKYTPSSEIRKISIGWDSNYGSLMSEFIEIYQSLEECGIEHIPVKLVDKVNFFFSQQLPANYLNTFFAYSFKTESDKVILKQIVTILMNTYTRSKVNNFTKCSGNIVDNIIFNHLSTYDTEKVLNSLALDSDLLFDTENISKTLLLDTIDKYIHRMEFLGNFELATESLTELLENCLDKKIPNNNPNLIHRCLNLIGKGILINQKSHYAPRSLRNPFNPWMKLNSIMLSCKLTKYVRYNLEQFAYYDSKNKDLYIQQLKNIIFNTNWKVIDPNNLVGGSIIEFLGIENPESLDEYITTNYLNTNKSKNLSLNNDVLKSICMTYCQIFDVHKAVDTVDILLKHNDREYDSMSVADVSYKIPYSTIMNHLLEEITSSISKSVNVNNLDPQQKGAIHLDAFSQNSELSQKYEMFMGIQQIIISKNIESRDNYGIIGDINNLSGHVRILFDSYLMFLKFMDYQSEKMNLDFIDYFKNVMADELKGAAGIEYKGFDEVMYFFHSILYNILPRLGNVEVGEEFIDYFYKEILIKHCMSSNETVNYEKDAEVYKMLFKEKFEYHASTKELENNKDPETQFENAIEAL